MVEVDFECEFRRIAELCEKHVGPRKFYLHNRIGGEGWDVRPVPLENHRWKQGSRARFDNPQMATFIMLHL